MARDSELETKVVHIGFGLNLAMFILVLLGIGSIAGGISGIDKEKRIRQLEVDVAGLKERLK
jgi:hypothetical protein